MRKLGEDIDSMLTEYSSAQLANDSVEEIIMIINTTKGEAGCFTIFHKPSLPLGRIRIPLRIITS